MYRNPFIPISLFTIFSFFFMFTVTAAPSNNLKKKVKKVVEEKSNQNMQLEVFNSNGKIQLTDVITSTDLHLDFDLSDLPKGSYTVSVSRDNEVINFTEISNLSKNYNELTLEVLDASGQRVYGSKEDSYNFDLSNMPKGKYLMKVYQGKNLINKNYIKN